MPVMSVTKPGSSQSFLDKPPIKLDFINGPPPCKKRKSSEDLDIQNHNDTTPNFDNNLNDIINDPSSSNPLIDKPSRKPGFGKQTINHPPSSGEGKSKEVLDNQHRNDTSSILKEHELKFDNCTFNNCTLNISPGYCNKENEPMNK